MARMQGERAPVALNQALDCCDELVVAEVICSAYRSALKTFARSSVHVRRLFVAH